MNNEDMKILEERVTTLKRHIKNYEESDCKTNVYQQLVKECRALENLLTRYKQLEEENKELVRQYEYQGAKMINEYMSFKNVKKLFIPKSKVKEKIEEYDKQRIKMEKDDIGIGFTLGKEWSDLKAKIEALQELLRGE